MSKPAFKVVYSLSNIRLVLVGNFPVSNGPLVLLLPQTLVLYVPT
jgi:hypothetical protein